MSIAISKQDLSAQPLTIPVSISPKMEVPEWGIKVVNLIRATQTSSSERAMTEFETLVKENQDKINQGIFTSDYTIFHKLALHKRPVEFVGILSRYGIDFSVQETFLGNTPLMWAIANGQNEMAREILLQLPVSQRSALDKQCFEGHSALHLIIGKGYTTRTSDNKPLMYSNFQLLQLAVYNGANVNLADNIGNTPLHLAYTRRDYDMIKLLIDNGADQNRLNNAGKKPSEMVQLGKDEDENYIKAQSVLFDTTTGCYILKENNYKDPINLQWIMQL